jgi:hypothetical protein
METTQEAQNIQTEIPGTEPTVAPTEKKERAKKDLSGEFRYYAVENPFNGSITVKRFRETVGVPLGAIFVQYKEGTPERAKYGEEDGTGLVTWFLQEARGVDRSKALASGTVPYVDHEDVRVQRAIVMVEAPAEPEKTKRAEKVKKEPKEKAVRKTREKKVFAPSEETVNTVDPPTFKYYEASDDEEVPTEETSKVQKFASKKEALSYARVLGLTSKDVEDRVKKIDGYWQIVQN